MQKTYKSPKKAVVSLTSLLDLLFVMIFVSMIQQKNISPTPKPVSKIKITKVKVTPKAKVEVKKITPKPVLKQYNIFAEFNFHSTNSNPGLPNGKYLMQGFYDSRDGSLKLGGVSWIKRPTGYDMVPLSGTIDSKYSSFTGRIEFPGCRKFTLRKVSKGQGDNPITGQWRGEYDCSQGATGLTLTVK
jgi:hypothetical protein